MSNPTPTRQSGFTLIEVMITVAIVAILAAIAIPQYRDYVLRGQLVDSTNMLSAAQANMERYYQDNRTYAATGSFTPPCTGTAGLFTLSCSGTSTTGYTLSATGSGNTAKFTYTVKQDNTKTTVISSGGPWPAGTSSCWVLKKGQGC